MTTAEYRSRYASTDIEDYEFACHVADCPEVSHESEDFVKCEMCGMRLCHEHAQYMLNDATLPLCEECAACVHPIFNPAHCDGKAAFLCDNCGAPTCWNCIKREDNNPIDAGYFCMACWEDSDHPSREYETCRFHAPGSLAATTEVCDATVPF